jgi:hypothetical protein
MLSTPPWPLITAVTVALFLNNNSIWQVTGFKRTRARLGLTYLPSFPWGTSIICLHPGAQLIDYGATRGFLAQSRSSIQMEYCLYLSVSSCNTCAVNLRGEQCEGAGCSMLRSKLKAQGLWRKGDHQSLSSVEFPYCAINDSGPIQGSINRWGLPTNVWGFNTRLATGPAHH